jgi:lipid A 3-O-deacylase
MKKTNHVIALVLGMAAAASTSAKGAEAELALAPADPTQGQSEAFAARPSDLWQGEVGEGFRSSVQTLSLETGLALGVQAFGGQQVHDLALLSLAYGHMLGRVVGEDHWYRGNWEVRAEVFGGGQFSPSSALLAGLTPHLRYDFATGTPWVPFADLGAGVTACGIGAPDLSGGFEFNLQGNIGAHWFVRENLAFTFEVGYLHLSCAGIHDPNLGANTIKGMIGLTWFF